jgi:feruloyl esterase
VHSDPNFSFTNFSIADIEYARELNPGNIATWNGDLHKFKQRGGKVLTYHGRSDPVQFAYYCTRSSFADIPDLKIIPSGNSNSLWNLVSSEVPGIDDFYRFFSIPGMSSSDH